MPGSLPVLSTGSSFCYPVQRTPQRRAGLHVFCDFSEVRYAKGGNATTEFTLEYRSISTADKELLRAFYATQAGEAYTDWSMIFDGTLYIGCQFIGIFDPVQTGPNSWRVSLRVRTVAANTNSTAPPTVPASPTLPPATTTGISITTAHSQAGNIYQYANIRGSSDGGATWSGLQVAAAWGNGVGAWAKRTDLITTGFTYSPGALRLQVWLETTSPFAFNAIGELDIYEVALLATLPDTTVQTLVPTVSVSGASTPWHYVQDPGSAVDGDATTFAKIYDDDRGSIGHLGDSPILTFIW